jgi:uncharacterized protein YbcC (UPF0753/DUF2309 family)
MVTEAAAKDIPLNDPPSEHDDRATLAHAIDHAAHLLPAQGPITVFIHHNTLHAFEDLPFIEGVKKGGRVFGCQPFLSEDRYREALARGRIRFVTLEAVLRERLGDRADERILRLCTRMEFKLAMLQYPLRYGPTEELMWFMADTDALRKVRPDVSAAVRGRLVAETRRWAMRDLRGGNEARRNGKHPAGRGRAPTLDPVFERFGEGGIETWGEETWEAFTLHALWRVCFVGVSGLPAFTPLPPHPIRQRDLLFQATGADPDPPVHDLLTRFTAAFLDQGFAPWPLPDRDLGFYRSFCRLYRTDTSPPDPWRRGLAAELARHEELYPDPLDSVRASLIDLGVPPAEWEGYVAATFLALRGWGGMVKQVEERADSVAHPIPKGSLVGFLAVRLILDRLSLAHTASEALGYDGPLAELRSLLRKRAEVDGRPSAEQRAFVLFQLAQVLGWTPEELGKLTPADWAVLAGEVESFASVDRREVFHLAYERRFRTQTLDALALHMPSVTDPPRPATFQVVTCLDEREESFRRHLEEIEPGCETFGAAGFYSVPMYYRGAADAHFVPLCPIVMKPAHWVTEQVDPEAEQTHKVQSLWRRLIGRVSYRFHLGTRSFALGAALSLAVGVLAAIPLTARVLFPRPTGRVRRLLARFVTPPATKLRLERHDPTPGPDNGHIGYTVTEMVNQAERLLRDIGLVDHFARLIFTLGHGSFSLNNPHKSAYDCGACGGSPGAPNGRAIAHILNDDRVRTGLSERGIQIHPTTRFVGGLHNTCNDSVSLFDLDRIPDSHRAEFGGARQVIEGACDRNAHERCRRFMSAPLTMTFKEARRHVEGRSEDLAQTRPELGHATNALCQVGRRRWTRGLYFDRRMFLTSYDPTIDDAQGTILQRTLMAVFPVCGGINLEYYFSHTDSPGYGCGTKLPHNVTALLGVMDGAASDLRTGLPWQMTEIHEPVRLLIVCETTPEVMLGIMDRVPMIGNMARKGWVQLALQDPRTGALKLFTNGGFADYQPQAEELPKAPSSTDWYRGCREHLEFAEIGT